MPSQFNDKQARRRRVLPGFPREEKFVTPESLVEYFGGAAITCLQCGKRYRTLGVHLKTIHGMEPDEYRDIYGIPWTYGLSCAATTQLHSDDAKMKIETGVFVPSKEQAKIARTRLSERKKRQPVQDVLVHRNLEKLNAGKTGEYASKRKAAPKRGTAEFKAKMRARPQMEQAKEMLTTYWKGREQTDEHVFNRTGHHKKAP
jgi:hypothetical protein